MQRTLSFPGGSFVVARLIANSSYLRGVSAGELSLSQQSRVASRQYASSSGQSGVGAAEKARLAAQQRAVARRVAGIDAKRVPLPPSLSFGNKHASVVAAQGETGSAGALRKPSTTHLPVVSDAGGAVPALSAPALVVTREFEFGNIFFGFEQANKYTIRAAPGGLVVGFIAEIDSMGKSIVRNVLRTHRSFKATVFDKDGVPVFEIRRPAYLISTNMYVHEPGDDGAEIGQIEMAWHPWKRRYRLFTNGVQFAECDTGFLGVDFEMKTEEGSTIARVNKDFTGFARELFTDARQYVIRLDPSYNMTADGFTNVDPSTIQAGHATAGTKEDTELGWKERAVVLASGICIDFDYFSLHSRGGLGPGGMFMPIPGGGSGAPAGGGAAGGAAGGSAAGSESGDGGGEPEFDQGFDGQRSSGDGNAGPEFGGPNGGNGPEWAEFEQPDLGFRGDPSSSDDGGWGGDKSDDDWGSGFGDSGIGDSGGGEEGGGAISKLFSIISSIFSNND